MSKRPSFEEAKAEALRDPETRAAYDALEGEFKSLQRGVEQAKCGEFVSDASLEQLRNK